MATFDLTTFAVPSDIQGMITDLKIVVHMEVDLGYWQNKILLSKNRTLKNDLIKECRRRFPKTMKDWQRKLRQDIDRFRSEFDRDKYQSHITEIDQPNSLFPLGGFSSLTYGGIAGFGLVTEVQDPPVIFNSGVPGSSVKAKPGKICIDTNSLDDEHAYINRGTFDAPNWQIWNADDGINFIFNPEVLVNCQCATALVWAARDGLFADTPEFSSPMNKGFRMDVKAMLEREYEEAKYGTLADDGKSRVSKSEGDFPLIKWDIDGDGVIQDFETEIDEDIEEEVGAW